MTFTTFEGEREGVFRVPHNTIRHDERVCEGTAEKSMFYYNSSLVEDASIPAGLQRVLRIAGFNNATTSNLLAAEDPFLVGFVDPLGMFCGSTRLVNGSVLFLTRPFKRVVLPQGLSPMVPGFKYQVAVPRFADNTACVFRQEIAGAANNDEDSDAEDSDDEDGDNEESGASGDDDGDDDEPACFPGDATVRLENGRHKRMDKLEIGDRVQTSKNSYSDVFMFTHKLRDGEYKFIEVDTASGASIRLTGGHYLYLNGRLAAASTAKVGDAVSLASGETSHITQVKSVKGTGLYNPQTIHGDIVVDGVTSSTYSTAVAPTLAHYLLCPFRTVYKTFGFSTTAFDKGGRGLESLAPRGALSY